MWGMDVHEEFSSEFHCQPLFHPLVLSFAGSFLKLPCPLYSFMMAPSSVWSRYRWPGEGW